ncbi:MAG: nucleotidyltransferase family protein [Clostridiales bacterium]|jgi:glucose-1-phosphate thymidylyltransferase|nr:nucleotidyltransferase family protein [Clostridiales bacterium]
MKAVILVAGYATRLYPLTLNMPKALLEVQGKKIIDYIVEQINAVEDVDGIYVVSNHKFASHFEEWAESAHAKAPVKVVDDGTTNEENRRGAIGDISYVLEEEMIDDEVVVIAGDNLFTFELARYYEYYKKTGTDCVCVKRINDKEALKQFGVALLDENNLVTELVEKPREPKSDCVVFATYMYKKDTIPLFRRYLDEGNKPDAPGYFVEWLCKIRPVHAYVMDGECYDIGTPAAYEQAQKLVLAKRGKA